MACRPRNRNRVRNLKNVAEVRHAVRKSPILGSPMKNPNLGLVISVTSATGDCNAWPFQYQSVISSEIGRVQQDFSVKSPNGC